MKRIGAASTRSPALLVALLIPSLAAAQEPSPAGFVSFLFELGFAEEAALEARRLDELGLASQLRPEELMRIGTALAESGKPDAALFVLGLAAGATAEPDVAEERQLALAVAMLKAGASPLALQTLGRLEAFGANERTRSKARWLGCIGQVYARNSEASASCVRALLGQDAWAEELLEDLELDVELRSVIGGALSALVPGLGQLTGGDPADAALALLVNGGWMVGVVALALHGMAWDAGLLGAGFGLRYYTGNIHNGAEAWRARAEARRRRASEQLLMLLGRRSQGVGVGEK